MALQSAIYKQSNILIGHIVVLVNNKSHKFTPTKVIKASRKIK